MSTPRQLIPALCVVAALALAGCSDDSSPRSAGETSPPTSPSSSPTGSPTSTSSESPSSTPSDSPSSTPSDSPEDEPQAIAYAGGEAVGVQVRRPQDAENLRGAPADFKEFIGRTVRRLHADATCSGTAVGVTVEFLRTDGYASGGVNDCGGYQALWTVVDGHWQEVAGTQELWDCDVLEKYTFPSDIAGERCYDDDAQKERRYHQV